MVQCPDVLRESCLGASTHPVMHIVGYPYMMTTTQYSIVWKAELLQLLLTTANRRALYFGGLAPVRLLALHHYKVP